jgi:putative nucleotidyltransferase with HDIG domain
MPPKLANLPAFPSVAMKLLSLLASEESSFTTIAACIATDPVLTGALIRRANAADQQHFCEVRDVLQAAIALGLDQTREISLVTATSIYARSAMESETLRPCWHHTLACAIVASEVARLWGLRMAESYTAGLLHDIGRLGLLTAYPAEYAEIIEGADGQPHDLMSLERERFGVDHVEVGEWLARRWNLPESIVEVIVRHHETPTGALDQVTVVQTSCRLADLLGFGVNNAGASPNLEEICAALPEWTRERLCAQIHTLQDIVAREIRLFEGTEDTAPGIPVVAVDDRKPEQGAPAYHYPHDVSTNLPSLATMFTIIAVLISVAAMFIQR